MVLEFIFNCSKVLTRKDTFKVKGQEISFVSYSLFQQNYRKLKKTLHTGMFS